MPIGTGIIYNVGDLILSQVSGSGTSFLETKIAAATSSIVYFDSTARINSASLNSITVGTASYVSGSTSIITNLTASNISASGTGSFGMVGIGTTVPSAKLTIVENTNGGTINLVGRTSDDTAAINFRATGDASTYAYISPDTNEFRLYHNDGFMSFYPGGSEKVRISSTGLVGIGTTVPGALLHVYTGSIGGTAYPLLIDNSSGGAGVNVVGFGFANGGIMKHSITTAIYGNDYMAFNVGQGASYNQERMRIDASGNVGIGTTSPGAKLEISSSTAASLLNVKGAGGNGILFVSGSGNVGIGTTVTVAKLQVAGAGIFASELLHNSSDQIGWVNAKFTDYNDGHGIYISSLQAGGGKWLSGEGRYWNSSFWRSTSTTSTAISLDSGALKFYTNSGLTANSDFQPSERMRINSAGLVGIGTTSPAYLLDVSGSSRHGYRAADTHQFTGSVSVSGSVTAASFTGSLSGSITSALTASYLTPANSYTITNLTASNISASGTGSFGIVGIGTTSFAYSTANRGVVEIYGSTDGLLALRNSTGNLYIQKTTTDVYINNESNGFIVISNNGSERWRITSAGILQSNGAQTIQTSTGNLTLATNAANGHILLSPNGSGNVGIGTTNPTNELHIYKLTGPTLNLQAGGTGTDGFKIIKGDSGEAYVYNQGAYGLSIGTNNTQRIYITSTGNVGIGTTSPTGSLHVYKAVGVGETTVATIQEGAGGAAELVFRSGVSGSNRRGALRFFSNEVSTTTAQWVVGASLNQSLGDNSFYFYNSSSTSILTLSQTNVGIGTTNPVAKLQVAGNVSGSSFTSSISNAVGFLGTSSWAQNVVSASYALTSSFATTAQTANALNVANTYTIAGLTSAYVDVNGSSAPTTGIYRPSTKTLGLSADGTLIFKISNVSAPATSSIETGNFVVQSGNFGLGTNSPNNKLDIFGGTGTTLNMSNVDDGSRGGKLTFISSSATGRQFYVGTNSSIYNLVFGIDSIEKMRLDTSGYFAINTTNTTPYSSLFPGQLVVDAGTSNVDGIFSSTNNTNAAELILTKKNPTNNFGSLLIQHSGSSGDAIALNYNVNTSTGAGGTNSFKVTTDGTGYFRGNVGIGTTSPAQKLEVQSGSVLIRGDGTALFGTYYASAGENTFFTLHSGSGNTFHIGNDVSGTNYTTMVFTAAPSSIGGSVGIGTTSPGSKLQINDNTPVLTIRTNDGGTSRKAYIDFYTTFFNYPADVGARRTSTIVTGFDSGTWGTEFLAFNVGSGSTNDAALLPIERVRINGSGNVGIGTTAPAAKLEISGSSNSVLLNIKSAISGAILYVSGSGAVGIGTSNVGAYTLQVSGSFAATTKSFVIEHPTKAGKKLIYGSLESPYHGIRLTGRDTLKEGKCKIQLPDYMYKLILHDSVNIQLTGIKCNKTLYIDDINVPENYFTIAYDKAIFESYKDYDFFWDFTAIRADVPELQTEM